MFQNKDWALAPKIRLKPILFCHKNPRPEGRGN
jgi:hypothetical protein